MKYYKLDLSKAEVLPSWIPEELRSVDIICQTGTHLCDLDVIDNSIPLDILIKTRDAIYKSGRYTKAEKDDLYSIPIGFDFKKIPVGCSITVIEKPDWIITLNRK